MALDPRADAIILEESFYKALRRWGGSGGFSGGGSKGGAFSGSGTAASATATASGTGGLSAIGDKLKSAFDTVKIEVTEGATATGRSLVDFSGKLIQGGVKVSDVTGILEREFSRASTAGSVLGTTVSTASEILGGMAKYVEEGVDVFRDLSKTGANFNNDVVELRNAAANSRLSLNEFQDVVKNNAKGLASLDGTVGKGTKVFTDLSKSFFDSRAGDNLRLLGYTTKDVNELLVVQLAGMTKRELAESGGQKAALERLERMGKEMDAVAKLTGIRRDELDKELRKNREDAQRRAAVESFILDGAKNARAAMDTATTQFTKAGPSFAKAAAEIVTAGRALGPETAAITGTMSGEVQQALAEARQAVKEGREEDARAASERAATLYAAQSATKTNLDLAAQGVDVFKSKMEAIDFGKKLNETAAEFRAQGMTEQQAIMAANEKLKTEVQANQNAQSGATSTAILLEARLQDASAALNNALILNLNKGVDPALKDFANSLRNFQSGPGGARGKIERGIEGIGNTAIAKAQGAAETVLGNRFFQEPQIPNFTSSQLEKTNKEILAALRDPKGGQAVDIPNANELVRALEAKDREAVTAKIETIAKQNNQSVEQLIRSLLDKGELGKLKQELLNDPTTSAAMRRSEETRQRRERGSRFEEESGRRGRQPNVGPLTELVNGSLIEGLFTSTPGKVTVENPVRIEGVGREAIGSKGVFGDWFGGPMNRLSFLGENEEEAVVPKSKIKEFISDMMGSGSMTGAVDENSIGNILRGATSSLGMKSPSGDMFAKSISAEEIEKQATASMVSKSVTATLDDVVKELEYLNSKIADLTEETKTIGAKQERATRSNNQNIFQR